MAFDLFEGLEKLSAGDAQWYDKLTPEGQKGAAPFVVARWLTGTSDQAQLVRLNTFVNPYVFSLGAEKSLLFKLMAAAATGKSRRYQWIKAPGGIKSRLRLEVIKQYYELSTREAELAAPNISAETLLEMAEELGYEKDELSKLKKELDEQGTTPKPSSKKTKPRP